MAMVTAVPRDDDRYGMCQSRCLQMILQRTETVFEAICSRKRAHMCVSGRRCVCKSQIAPTDAAVVVPSCRSMCSTQLRCQRGVEATSSRMQVIRLRSGYAQQRIHKQWSLRALCADRKAMRVPDARLAKEIDLVPLSRCFHFVNLTNGLEAIPHLTALGLPYQFTRCFTAADPRAR
jgi:hypothetical protein